MKKESQPGGDLRRNQCGAQLVSLLGGQSTGQIDVHRANGTLPADRYAEYVSGMAHRMIGDV